MLPHVFVAGILLIAIVVGLVAQALHAAYQRRATEQAEHQQVLACLTNADALAGAAVAEISRHYDERAAA